MKNHINFFLILFLSLNFVDGQEKIIITKAEDLPKHSYELKNKDALSTVKSKESILELAEMVKKDLLADLDKYDIKENATLRGYYGRLRLISILEEDFEKALDYIRKQRELADKESDKVIIGIQSEMLINAMLESKTMDTTLLNPQITKSLEQRLNANDFSIIQEEIESAKGQSEILSENLLLGIIKSQLQPALDNNKAEIPGNLVFSIVNMHFNLNYYLPYKEAYYKAYNNVLEKNIKNVEKTNIWLDREVLIADNPKYSPVIIGVWDGGVDIPIFSKNNQWINPKEKFDGKDTDGNGFIDDVYGIAYDLNSLKDPHYLEPEADAMEDKKKYQERIKGLMDLQANINSQEASNLKRYLSQLNPEDVKVFIENLNRYSNYSHGTHVAGIAQAGNDMTKIMVIRMTYEYKSIPTPPTPERVANEVKSYSEIVKYLEDNHVKVVNMSWGSSYQGYVSSLELNGIGKDDDERKAIAKDYFTKLYDSFKAALESAPEILFVCSAGNSNDDVDFASKYPSSINLPNLITVGAVDIEGKKTSFTTEGKSVDVYANGYEVESYVPGGDRIAFSGTSMASPNVANLAGKILAVNSNLKPEEVITIIVKTATKSDEDENVLLINPKKAVEMALK